MAKSSTDCTCKWSPSIIRIGRTSSLHLGKDDQCKGCGERHKTSPMDRLDSLHCKYLVNP